MLVFQFNGWFCGFASNEHGVIVHDDILHPQEMDFADEEKPQ